MRILAPALLVVASLMPVVGQAGPPVTVTLLDGSTQQGELQTLTADSLRVSTDSGAQTIPTDQLMEIGFTAAPVNADGLAVTLADRSLFRTRSFQSDGTNTKLTTAAFGEIEIPTRQVSDVRFSPLDDKVAATWKDLCARNTRDDLVVFRKGDVLDYSAGSVGRITDDAVTILVRGRELSAPRERVFGVVFATRAPVNSDRKIVVQTAPQDALVATEVDLQGETLQLQIASAGRLTLPLSQVSSLDYGGGRIKFLADLPFDGSESRAPNPESSVLWFTSKNSPAGSGGRMPLVIGKQDFRRGLWLHSGSVLRFRLNRDFTRLKATAGFDLTHVTQMPRFDPQVRLVIQGDGKELYSQQFHWNDPATPLDVDLTDVRELIIRVESLGSQKGVLEHFALGDAQVIQ